LTHFFFGHGVYYSNNTEAQRIGNMHDVEINPNRNKNPSRMSQALQRLIAQYEKAFIKKFISSAFLSSSERS